jgi:hypothetical protein
MPKSRHRSAWIAALMPIAAGLCGCDSLNTMKPGGRMASLDQHTYTSTAHSPKTVRLVDTRSQEEIWSMDVPVGQKLVMRFYADKSKGNVHNPDVMRWRLIPTMRGTTRLDNSMPVPASWARRIEWELRSGPEYAPDTPTVATDLMPTGGPVPPARVEPGEG